jgi:hypothetical protein
MDKLIKDDMSCHMMRGTITNEETGETWEIEHFLYSNEARISATAMIEKVEDFTHPDNSMQISVDCHALDSLGNVFALNMQFTPETVEKRDELLQDFTIGRILYVEGGYTAMKDEAVTIYDADYQPLAGELKKFAGEAFRVNFGKQEG